MFRKPPFLLMTLVFALGSLSCPRFAAAQTAQPKAQDPNPEAHTQSQRNRDEDSQTLLKRLQKLERQVARQARQLAAQQRRIDRAQSESKDPESRETAAKGDIEKSEDKGSLTFDDVRLGLFYIETKDKKYKLQFGLTATAHSIHSLDNRDFNDTIEMRYLRLTFSGQLSKWLTYAVDLEFGRTAAADLRNAWMNIHLSPYFQLRVGQMLYPFSVERLIPIRFLLHPERPIVIFDQVTPFQLGAMVHGDIIKDQLRYFVGVFNGNGANTARDNDDAKDLAARIEYEPMKGLIFSVSGILSPSGDGVGGPSDVRTVGNQSFRFIDYNDQPVGQGGNDQRGPRHRGSVGFQWLRGPFSWFADLILVRESDLRSSQGQEDNFLTTSFYTDLAYVITGETKTQTVAPSDPFFGDKGLGLGAWELAFRFETYEVDKDLFRRGFATGTDRVISETITINWYAQAGALLALSYTHSEFNESVLDSRGKRHHGDDAFVLRMTLFF